MNWLLGTRILCVCVCVCVHADQSVNVFTCKPQIYNRPLYAGLTSPDQKVPTPFVIEWIPDILPKSRIGELRIKFEYGHQRNGQVDHRPSPVTQTEMELQIVHVQPTL